MLGIGFVQQIGGLERFLRADGEGFARFDAAVEVLDEEAVAAAPVILAEGEAGGIILIKHAAVLHLHGHAVAVEADVAILALQADLHGGVAHAAVGSVEQEKIIDLTIQTFVSKGIRASEDESFQRRCCESFISSTT